MPESDRIPDLHVTPPAIGCGPNAGGAFSQEDYHHPAAAWGAAISVGLVLLEQQELIDGTRVVFNMNHENGGYDCPGCAWPDDRHGLSMDICENGIKHATWELTKKRATPEFFAAHTVAELSGWSDFALEDVGRLTEPMRYDAASDKYVPVSWDEAFALIGRHLRGLASPNEAAFYTSGRLSNEATFLYQLWARELGTNNLPDCSNMCHEASGRAMQAALGTGKGTCDLVDWEKTDCLIVMGVNAASNAPRMLTSLAEAYRRGANIIHVNPLVEAAARRTIVPHDILRMATFQSTRTSTLNVQPRIAGDLALMRGIAKHLFEAFVTDPKTIDRQFVECHTSGFEAYKSLVEATPWSEIERQSSVAEAKIREVGEVYRKSRSAIISWCLGVTQQGARRRHDPGDCQRPPAPGRQYRASRTRGSRTTLPDPGDTRTSRATAPAASTTSPAKTGSRVWIEPAGSHHREPTGLTPFASSRR